jgi:hypothetical protein
MRQHFSPFHTPGTWFSPAPNNSTSHSHNQPSIPDSGMILGKVSEETNKIVEALNSVSKTLEQIPTSVSPVRVFDIDSTYRNRVQFPLPSNFVVPYSNGSPGYNTFTSQDPVSESYPFSQGITQAGSTTTTVVLGSSSNSLDNFYINSVLEISGQFVTITNYVGATQTATITPALSVAPPAGTPYIIREAIPVAEGTLRAGSTQNQVVFPLSFSTITGTYVGNFILFTSGPDQGQVRAITAYDGTTQIATLSAALPVVPGLDNFELDSFSRDNAIPLRYSGSRTLSQPVCYVLQLMQLAIPNLTLKVGYGGTVANYPYLYLHFYNENKHSETIMYGNNPNATTATFRIPVSSVVAQARVQGTPNWFVFDDAVQALTPQSLKFSPHESIRFRVTLPSGEDLQFIESDTLPPALPNPIVQISGLVALRLVPVNAIPTFSGSSNGNK